VWGGDKQPRCRGKESGVGSAVVDAKDRPRNDRLPPRPRLEKTQSNKRERKIDTTKPGRCDSSYLSRVDKGEGDQKKTKRKPGNWTGDHRADR